MRAPDLTFTAYDRRQRRATRDLTFYNYHVHTHLDWQSTDDWLRNEHTRLSLAWRDGRMVGALGASPPLNGTVWIRMAAISDGEQPGEVLKALWSYTSEQLREKGVTRAAVLVTREWLGQYLDDLGFAYLEDIVTLRRTGRRMPESDREPPKIRAIDLVDIPVVTAIDQAAFEPLWQLSENDVRQAVRIAAYASVAVVDDEIVGYQVSTSHGLSAHLARLAVNPALQGQGIGGALLRDMLLRFFRRTMFTSTVNTQESNIRSQRLYEYFGFQRNYYDLPVWVTDFDGGAG